MNAYYKQLHDATNQEQFTAANAAIAADIAVDPEGTLKNLALAYQQAKVAELGADASYQEVAAKLQTSDIMFDRATAWDRYCAWLKETGIANELHKHLGDCAIQIKEERQ